MLAYYTIMVKNIIIIFLSILTCLSLVFAYMQRVQADECRIKAIEARVQAEEALQSALEQTKLAREIAELEATMHILAAKR